MNMLLVVSAVLQYTDMKGVNNAPQADSNQVPFSLVCTSTSASIRIVVRTHIISNNV
jgi:hypothetical protein